MGNGRMDNACVLPNFISCESGLQLITKIYEYYGHIGCVRLLCGKLKYYNFKDIDKIIYYLCNICEII